MAGQIGRFILKGAPKAAKLAKKFLPKAKNAEKAAKATKNSTFKKALGNKKVPNNVVGKQGAPKADVNEPIKGLSIEHKLSAVNGKKVAIAGAGMASVSSFIACNPDDGRIMTPKDMIDWYHKHNTISDSDESHSYSESFSISRSEAEAHVNWDAPDEPIEGNYYDHVEDILYALYGDEARQNGMVEEFGLFKCFDNVEYAAHTDGAASVKSFTFQDRLVKGKQAMATTRTADPGESNEDISHSRYTVSEAAPGLKLVTINGGVADGAHFAVALDSRNHSVYMYPYLSDAEETMLNENESYRDAAPAAKENYRNAILADKMKNLAVSNGYTLVTNGAKDGNGSNGVSYTYYTMNSNGTVTNYIVTPEGTWSQVVEVDGANNAKPFMDNDDSNNLPDQHSPLP